MKQILQNLSNGETQIVEVPRPNISKGALLIASNKTLVSLGTEKMLLEFGKANLFQKARQQPDKVKQVLNKIRVDGLISTLEAVKSKLDQPIPLGYCNVGKVIKSNVDALSINDRVVSNSPHAEIVVAHKNLCALIPDDVDDESASFTVLGAVGLQGIRLLKPTLGESIAIFGLGLIGLMTIQMLKANGCRVLGIDTDSSRCALAKEFGIDTLDLSSGQDLNSTATIFSQGRGIDGVIITATSNSDEVVHQAANICRKRGRIILVGAVGLNLVRDDFYEKEISFQVSSSYGPGRYDPAYEEEGHDYPLGFVRWTEQRNFEAVLNMMADGSLDVKPLITHRFSIDQALDGYKILGEASTLGVIIDYDHDNNNASEIRNIRLTEEDIKFNPENPIIGFIGAGNYASRILIPAFRSSGANLQNIITNHGISGVYHGDKNNFKETSTDLNDLWQDDSINAVVIATRHNQHANQVLEAINASKNIFVEKPLALNLEELNTIDEAYTNFNNSTDKQIRLMVGFNRRFAPMIAKMKQLLENKEEPKSIIMTINPGAIPSEHWTQNKEIGGGRIIGEACHFIDLARFLIGANINSFNSMMMGGSSNYEANDDKSIINLAFDDGSIAAIHYLANGSNIFPKERIEVFCNNAVIQMNNYRSLKGFGWKGFSKMHSFKQDKGQKLAAKAFVDSIKNGSPSPIPYNEILEVASYSIEIANSLRT